MRPAFTARLIVTTLAVLALAGCELKRGLLLPPLPDWETRSRVLAEIDEWEFRGRIGVSGGSEGFNGKLRYVQSNEEFKATVSGPLGFGTVHITGDSRQVTITDNDGEVWMLPDPEVDLQVMYGWTIPVASLRYWALGIPDPAGLALTDVGEDGLLRSLDQGNWQVEFADYRDGGGQPMPRRLAAVSGDNKVRLVIDNWKFR